MDENFLASLLGGQQPSFGVPADVSNFGQPAPADSFGVPASVANFGQGAPLQPPAGTGSSVDQTANIMQALNGGGAPAPAPAAPPQPSVAAQVAGAMQGDPAQPRQRHSILDTLGRISDVLAKVGGAPAQYQPSLDAATARANALTDRATAAGDHTRQVDMDNLRMALTKNQITSAATTADQASAGKAIQNLQAVVKAGGDPVKAWATYAKLQGVSPAMTQQIQGILDTRGAGAVDEIDQGLNGIEEFSQAAIPYYKSDGSIGYVQPGKHGQSNDVELPDGAKGFVPQKVEHVDLGDRVGMTVGGRIVSTMRKGVSPDTSANVAGRTEVAEINANKPGKTGAGGKAGAVDPYTAYSGARSATVRMRDAINDLVNDPNLSSATGYIAGGVDTPARQRINGKVAAIQGMAVPVATALLKAQGVQRPAQAEVLSTAKGIISDLGLLRQSTGDYKIGAQKAAAALTERIAGLDADAKRTGIAGGGAAPAPQSRRILPAPAGARRTPSQPNVVNW